MLAKIHTLAEVVGLLSGQLDLGRVTAGVDKLFSRLNRYEIDFPDVRGQEFAKQGAKYHGWHNDLWTASRVCVTLSPVPGRPGLYSRLLKPNHNALAEDVVEFLEELRGQLRGPFTVIWDRHKIHSQSKVVKAYLAKHKKIVVEDLPAYAPEANPDKWV